MSVDEEGNGITPESSVELKGVVGMPVESTMEEPVVSGTEPVESEIESLEVPISSL